MSDHPPILIVDKDDKPVGESSMLEAYDKGLFHRTASVIVEDLQGRILLQKRGPTMVNFPNCWDISAAGHVDTGEDYLDAARREAKEELGLSNIELEEVTSFYGEIETNGRILKRFNKVYRTVLPKDTKFDPDPTEIAELKWYRIEDVKKLVSEHPEKVAAGFVYFVNKYGL